MTQLPDEVKMTFETTEGYEISKREIDVLDELVSAFNELREYVKERFEPLS